MKGFSTPSEAGSGISHRLPWYVSLSCPFLSFSPSLTWQELEAEQALGLQLPAGWEQPFVAVVRAGLVMLSLLLSAPRIPFAEVSDTRPPLRLSSSCTEGRSSLIEVDSEEGPV